MTCSSALPCGHARPIRRAKAAIPEDLRFVRFLAVFAGGTRAAAYRDITSQAGGGTIGPTSSHEITAVSRRGYIPLVPLLVGRHVSHNVAINLANLLRMSVTEPALPSRRMPGSRSAYAPAETERKGTLLGVTVADGVGHGPQSGHDQDKTPQPRTTRNRTPGTAAMKVRHTALGASGVL